MSEIKRHLCESCGAVLDVDLEKQIYTCPFCGITYDYAYFKEDDILQKVEVFIGRKEYKAAIDALNFYLAKNPHDGYTLEKLMLLTYEIPSVQKLRSKQIQDNFDRDPEETRWILERAQGEYVERLNSIHELLGKMNQINELNKKIREVEKKIADADHDVDHARIKIAENYCSGDTKYDTEYTTSIHPKKYMRSAVISGVIVGGFGILAGMSFYAKGAHATGWIFGILAVLYAVAVTLGTYYTKVEPKLKEITYFQNKLTEAEFKKKGQEEERTRLLDECNELRQYINRAVLKLTAGGNDEDKETAV